MSPGLGGLDRPDQSLALGLWNPLFAGLVNLTNPEEAPRSNLGFAAGGFVDAPLAASGVGCVVACPALNEDVITRISLLGGGTAEATGTHAWAAIYSGLPTAAGSVLLDKSTDFTTANAIGASGRFDFTGFAGVPLTGLSAAGGPQAATAPQNFIYVMICVVAGTIPSVLSLSTPTTINYQWTSQAPVVVAGNVGAGLTTPGTAPANLAGLTARANAPVVIAC